MKRLLLVGLIGLIAFIVSGCNPDGTPDAEDLLMMNNFMQGLAARQTDLPTIANGIQVMMGGQ